MPETLYKVLAEDGAPHHGGSGRWHLPRGTRPGKWMPKITDVEPCHRGYHVCRPDQVIQWLGPTIWTVEVRGAVIDHGDKLVVGEARLLAKCDHWNDRTARLFAAACARDVLPIFERAYPGDDRVRRCIETVEAFARGEVDKTVLAAVRAAAWDASAAARAAAWARQTRRLLHLLATGDVLQEVPDA